MQNNSLTIRQARLQGQEGLWQITIEDGRFSRIDPQETASAPVGQVLDAECGLVIPPFIEPHIHLDTTQTAGEPNWNQSGTLFEGLNIDGKEIEKTSSCIIKIKISGLNENTLFQHIEIVKYKYNKRKIREIQFSDFTKMLEKNEFNIEFDYYSDFARSILLIGDVKDSAIVIRIEDIENIEFVFV